MLLILGDKVTTFRAYIWIIIGQKTKKTGQNDVTCIFYTQNMSKSFSLDSSAKILLIQFVVQIN